MDLHAEIMNIPANIVLTGPEGVGNVHSNPYIAYKEGHRDARHDAAELALKAQARIEELEDILAAFVNWQTDAEGKLSMLDDDELWLKAEDVLNKK